MVDRAQSIPRQKINMVVGRLDESTLIAVDRALAMFLGIAK